MLTARPRTSPHSLGMHLAGGTVIFVLFVVFYFVVIAYGLYTRRGSAINQHPYNNPYGDTPGAARKSSLGHDERATFERARGTR
jgi:hypothetical protein